MRRLLLASLLGSSLLARPGLAAPPHAAKGIDPLWTDSHARGDGVSSMQAFSKLARALGPAVVNIVEIGRAHV